MGKFDIIFRLLFGGHQDFLTTVRVYSTGHGQHADYLFGWKDNALQRSMDELGKNGCTVDVCSSALKIQDGKDAIACTKAQQVKESVGTKGECKYSSLVSLSTVSELVPI